MTATLNLPDAQALTSAHNPLASGATSSSDHSANDFQTIAVAAGPNFPSATRDASAQRSIAEGAQLTDDQCLRASHGAYVVGAQPAVPIEQSHPHPRIGTATNSTPGHAPGDHQPPSARGGFLRDPVLGVLADVLDDLEMVRIANANRVRILTRTEADDDGEERGHGLTVDHPQVKALALTVKALEVAEHEAVLNLQRSMRKHPLAGFQKRHKGIGEKQLARLLATLGDPYWNDLHQRPRTVSELWAYCGFHVLHPGGQAAIATQPESAAGVAPKRTRGQKSNWSEDARKRTWVIASAMPKFAGGHYESVYRDARVKYAETVHSSACVRCGPKNKPAEAGTPLSDGHKHARAIRITAKEILKDLWIEAKSIHELPESTRWLDTQNASDSGSNPRSAPNAAKRGAERATKDGVS